ncbi:transcriptional regulator [Janthinobacterium sp. BJB412]|nr:transcriptional regulator [Janthinobacterium sp. BJB412]
MEPQSAPAPMAPPPYYELADMNTRLSSLSAPAPAAASANFAGFPAYHLGPRAAMDHAGELGRLAGRRIKVPRESALYRHGDLVEGHFYAVQYGVIKNVRATTDGQLRVCAFQMSGDFLALEAIGQARHSCSAIALEDSEVREFRDDSTQSALAHFHCVLSKQVAREQNIALMLRNSSAEKRLAGFLLDLSWRFHARGYSARRFHLAMPRQDIANFLALSPECVSRTLFQFKCAGLLAISDRDITLLDAPALELLALGASPAESAARRSAPAQHPATRSPA